MRTELSGSKAAYLKLLGTSCFDRHLLQTDEQRQGQAGRVSLHLCWLQQVLECRGCPKRWFGSLWSWKARLSMGLRGAYWTTRTSMNVSDAEDLLRTHQVEASTEVCMDTKEPSLPSNFSLQVCRVDPTASLAVIPLGKSSSGEKMAKEACVTPHLEKMLSRAHSDYVLQIVHKGCQLIAGKLCWFSSCS